MKIWPAILVPSAFVSFGAGIVVGILISQSSPPIVAQPAPQPAHEAPPQVAPQPAKAAPPKDPGPIQPARKTRKQVIEEVLHDYPENAKPPFGAAYAVKESRAEDWFQKHAVGRELAFKEIAKVCISKTSSGTYTAVVTYDLPAKESQDPSTLAYGMIPSQIMFHDEALARIEGLSEAQAEDVAKLDGTVVEFKGLLSNRFPILKLVKARMNGWKLTDNESGLRNAPMDTPK